jgi:ankyrin repeat protein
MTAETALLDPTAELMDALSRDDTARAKEVLKATFDVNASNRVDLVTPLMSAVRGHHEDIVRLLLEKGADINARNAENQTALMYAAWSVDAGIVRLLIERGADIEACSKGGTTALSQALKMTQSTEVSSVSEIVQILQDAAEARQRLATCHQTAIERQAALKGHKRPILKF